jgi:hypothetical protein
MFVNLNPDAFYLIERDLVTASIIVPVVRADVGLHSNPGIILFELICCT